MTHIKVKQFAVLAVAALLSTSALIGCKKDKNDAPLPVKLQQLTARNWKINTVTTPSISNPTVDSSLLKGCMSDDSIKFNTTFSYQIKDGTVKCDSTIIPYGSGTWSFNTSTDSLYITKSNATIAYKLASISDSTVVIRWKHPVTGNGTVVRTLQLKK